MSSVLQAEHDVGDKLDETEEEAREYDQRVKEEIKWKLEPGAVGDGSQVDDLDVEVGTAPDKSNYAPAVASSPATLRAEQRSVVTIADGDVGPPPSAAMAEEAIPAPSFRPANFSHSTPNVRAVGGARASSLSGMTQPAPSPTSIAEVEPFPAPSFRPSNFAQSTPRPVASGSGSTSTFPHVPTPTFISTPQLPRPPVALVPDSSGPSRGRVAETPVHVPSPIDTPSTTGGGEGRGRRDDPATPVPLGVEKFKLLKGKKDFQTLTKHFEVFTKQTEKQQKKLAEEISKGQGKGKGKAREVAALGGKVFEGLRFCFPPELGNTSKQKTHWDIVSPPLHFLARVGPYWKG